jgi:hypothetical protein
MHCALPPPQAGREPAVRVVRESLTRARYPRNTPPVRLPTSAVITFLSTFWAARVTPAGSGMRVRALLDLFRRQAPLQHVGGGDGVGGDTRVAGAALLEMYDGNDRLVLDHGASGAPVLDCAGRVVAVVSNVYVRTMRLASEELRITTAWGSANVASVPVPVLRDFSRVE